MSLLGRTDYFEVLLSTLGESANYSVALAILAQTGRQRLSRFKLQ